MERLTDQIEALVRSSMEAGATGGAVILVERDGEIVAHHGIGRAEFDSSFELKPDSIFGMMSMTKPVTAASALILNSDGKLELEASVSRYIPEFAKPRRVRTLKPGESYPSFPPAPGAPTPPEPAYDYAPAHREITVRDLLTFTSGLQTIGVPNGAPRILPEDTLASLVAKLDSVPLEFQPGSQWHYSNATGYDVLGRIIEVASGKSFQEFAHERLFAPLEMKETQFGINPALKGRIVPLGFLAGEAISRQDYPSGSAGLFSTATDYAKFVRMLLDDGVFKGRQVMKPEAAKAMHCPQIGDIPFEGIRVSEYAPYSPQEIAIHVRLWGGSACRTFG